MGVQYIASGDKPFHLSVGAALISKNRQLLTLKRPGGAHILPRGSMEPGETIEATLARELLEETGYQAKPVAFLGTIISHFERDGAQIEKTTLYHLLESPVRLKDGPAPGDDEQASEICWIAQEDASRLLKEDEVGIANRAFQIFDA